MSKGKDLFYRLAGDSTACLAFVPFENMLKGIYDGQVKIASLPIDLRIAVRSHEELRFLDAKRNLVECIQDLLPKLFEMNRCLHLISSCYESAVDQRLTSNITVKPPQTIEP
jgi:hypothetical protein